MPYLGVNSCVMIGEESTWGTAVSRTHSYRLMSSSLRRVVDKAARETLYEGSGLVSRKRFIRADKVEGSITFLATFHAMGVWLKHALWGTPGTTGPSGGYYTHTYTLGASAPTGGLTIEIVQGGGSAIVYEGCRISKLTAKLAAAGVMEVTVDIIGETSGAPTSAGTPTFTTTETELEHYMAGTIGWNSDTYTAKSIELAIDNKLEPRQLLGSKLTKDPKPTALRTISFSADMEYESDDPQTDYTGDTESDLVFAVTSGTFSLTITVHNAYLTKDEIGIDQHGPLGEAVAWMGQSDATDKGISIVVVNTQSSAVAA